jgi:hypothetical protein
LTNEKSSASSAAPLQSGQRIFTLQFEPRKYNNVAKLCPEL